MLLSAGRGGRMLVAFVTGSRACFRCDPRLSLTLAGGNLVRQVETNFARLIGARSGMRYFKHEVVMNFARSPFCFFKSWVLRYIMCPASYSSWVMFLASAGLVLR